MLAGMLAAFAETVDAIAGILWVSIAAAGLAFVLPQLRRVMKSQEFSIEVAGLKVSAQNASDQLAKHLEDLQTEVDALRSAVAATGAGQSEAPAAPTATPHTAGEVEGGDSQGEPAYEGPLVAEGGRWLADEPRSLLWVDDHPEGNAFQVKAFQDQGWDVRLARSTEEALAAVQDGRFDVVISDLGRDENGEHRRLAGAELLQRLRDSGDKTPFVVNTTPKRAAKEEAGLIAAGANAVTGTPSAMRRSIEVVLAKEFERRVADLLRRFDFELSASPLGIESSMLARRAGRTLAVEVVRRQTVEVSRRVREATLRLLALVQDVEPPPDDLIVVTPRRVRAASETPGHHDRVRIMSYDELEGFLKGIG